MHVAFYAPMKPPTDPTPSGDRRMARMLIGAWERSGHHVELASRFRSYDRGEADRQEKIRVVGEKLAGRLIRRYRSRPPDSRPKVWFTYHLYHKAPDWLGPTVSDALDIPYIVAEASYAPKQAGGPWDLGHRAVAETLSKADRIIGFNPGDAECVRPLLEDPEKQVMLPPFIDTDPYYGALLKGWLHRRRLSERYALNIEEPWLLSVAMMRNDQKLLSYQLLGKALEKIIDRPWRLLVAGSGPAAWAVKEALAPLGDRVVWLGRQSAEDLIPIYAGSDVFVWPAIKEAYGMVFLEALSAGLPVIAGRSPGVEGIVSDNTNGILAPLGDADAFASAVARLLDNPSLRCDMAINGIHDMLKSHDLPRMSNTLNQMANEIAFGGLH